MPTDAKGRLAVKPISADVDRAEESAPSGSLGPLNAITALLFLVVVVFAALYLSGFKTFGPSPSASTTTSTTIPPVSTTSTTVEETTTTADPLSLYPLLSVNDFVSNCTIPAVVKGAITVRELNLAGTIVQSAFVVPGLNGAEIQLLGYPPAQSPARIDATGSTFYFIYGTPQAVNGTNLLCQMNVQRITES